MEKHQMSNCQWGRFRNMICSSSWPGIAFSGRFFLAIVCLLALLWFLTSSFPKTLNCSPKFTFLQRKELLLTKSGLLAVNQSRDGIPPLAQSGLAVNQSRDRIPPLAHLIYINNVANDSAMIVNYRRCLETCLSSNPDMHFVLWMDWNVALLLDEFYPANSGDPLIQRLRSLTVDKKLPITLRSDILRYMLLDTFGGIYMDLDTVCQKPMYKTYFEPLRNTMVVGGDPEIQVQIIFNSEYLTSNNFLASSPGHPFVKQVLRNLPEKEIRNHVNAFYITGPQFLSIQLKSFLSVPRINYTQLVLRHEQPEQILPSPIYGGRLAVTNNSLFHPNLDVGKFSYYCNMKPSNTSQVYLGCNARKAYQEWYDAPNGGADSAVLLTVYEHLGWEPMSELMKKRRFFPFKDFPLLRSWPP